MPQGFESLREKVREMEERKAKALEGAGQNDYKPSLWWKLPDSAVGYQEEEITSSMRSIVRPLDTGQEVQIASVHKVENVPGMKYALDIVCRDQKNTGEPCPGCEAGLKRKIKGWTNVIWRDAPDFPQDPKTGKYLTNIDYDSVPKSDKLAIISSGPMLFNKLDELNDNLDGRLTDFDISLTREGLRLNTDYKVRKHEEVELSAEDKALAENKPDLSNFTKILSYEDWQARALGIKPTSNGNTGEEVPSVPQNPLGSRTKTIFDK